MPTPRPSASGSESHHHVDRNSDRTADPRSENIVTVRSWGLTVTSTPDEPIVIVAVAEVNLLTAPWTLAKAGMKMLTHVTKLAWEHRTDLNALTIGTQGHPTADDNRPSTLTVASERVDRPNT